jgi:hypothetical protein
LTACWLVLRLGLSTLPRGLNRRHLVVLGVVAGVGCTMALFVAQLAFTDARLLSAAKLGVLSASCGAAVLGLLLGWHALLPIWVVASLAAGAHAVAILLGRQLGMHLPMRVQLQVSRASEQWQTHPALRGMEAARQGRRGIPYAAYLALAAIGWLLATTYGGLA